jgi:hypothetical protein
MRYDVLTQNLLKKEAYMKFYTKQHKYYCGVAKTMYICIINKEGRVVKQKNISADAVFCPLPDPVTN